METQRFLIALATDGDVEGYEVRQTLEAVGFHGVIVVPARGHECPCPSNHCTDLLRKEGHDIPAGTMCCDCWAIG